MSLFSNFPQGGKKAGVQSISDGGTGATTAEAALANLGGFPKADGEALKTRIQPINLGGTGASEANQARQNLGAAAVKEMTKAEYDALAAIDPTIFYALTDVEANGTQIEVGSYVGTGKYGSSNACKIVCDFVPKLLVVYGKFGSDNSHSAYCSIPMVVQSGEYSYKGGSSFDISGTIVVSGNTVSFYQANNAYYMGNVSGLTYYYIAIG